MWPVYAFAVVSASSTTTFMRLTLQWAAKTLALSKYRSVGTNSVAVPEMDGELQHHVIRHAQADAGNERTR